MRVNFSVKLQCHRST